jgi:hypothetical protein
MTSKSELEMLARITAQERMIIWLARMVLKLSRTGAQDTALLRECIREIGEADTFPDLDPALSDHLSAEAQEKVDKLWRAILEMFASKA